MKNSLNILSPALLLAFFHAFSPAGHGEVKPAALFSDHMVLQRSEATPVWGKADPGEKISLTLNNQTQATTADGDGHWKVEWNLKDSPPGPFDLVIQGSRTVTLHDVLVGEVWIASGQSNMEFTLSRSLTAGEEAALPANPFLREFKVAKAAKALPQEDGVGKWTAAAPETVGEFSAVGYYFAKSLQSHLKGPVGIVNASWGGSSGEAWLSPQALEKEEGVKKQAAELWKKAAAYPEAQNLYASAFAAWLAEKGLSDKTAAPPETFAANDAPSEGWSPVTLPGPISGANLPNHGAVWIRRDIVIPPGEGGKWLRVELGSIDGFDAVYWNGKKLSETTFATSPGKGPRPQVIVGGALVQPGRNVLAVRIFAPIDRPQLVAAPEHFQVIQSQAAALPLSGPWMATAEYSLPDLAPEALQTAPSPPDPLYPQNQTASFLYNGMIHPLIPCAFRGVIWYQGEANAGRAAAYRTLFPHLIEGWRAAWQRGDFPFYFCQLPNYSPKSSSPGDSYWAELREAQSLALNLPNTAQAVLIDLGEASDIHPRHKKEAGERLARLALARDYAVPTGYSGPRYESMQVEGDTVRLKFSHAESGLAALPLPLTYDVQTLSQRTAPLVRNCPDSQLEGFALCGADRKWIWAQATIDNGTVVVWSPEVKQPVAVRYAWQNNPTCNLGNGDGLPASPFRTDDFPEVTRDVSY